MAHASGTAVEPGELLWQPRPDARKRTRIGHFLDWVERSRGIELPDYAAAWEWSVTDLEGFWQAIWDYFDVVAHDRPTQVLRDRTMPGAAWFPGATLNYAEHALRRADDRVAVVARSDTRADDVVLTAAELSDQVARAAAGLRRLGVDRGDRVVAYLPNIPETLVAMLAAASIGAVWSSCAPEFGIRSVTDRFQQIAPRVLLTVDGYRYGAKDVDRVDEVGAIRAQLPTLAATVVLPYLHPHGAEDRFPEATTWDQLLSQPAELTFTPVPFDHPLYVLYSSGTTGLPKPIVHGHGGVTLEHQKVLGLHLDLADGDRFFWFSTTGWMMWNFVVSGLLVGAAVVMYDGDPGHPDLDTLWRLAEELEVTYFGTSAPFLMACLRAGLEPGAAFDLRRVRGLGSTGSPLPPEGFAWVYDHVGPDLQLGSASGGTDVCTAFVAGSPLVAVHAGEIPCRCLGCKVEAFDADGRSVVGERGELVITQPLPSMPVGFWGDVGGEPGADWAVGERYRAAYFENFPGVWRHGDWLEITERGSCIITGRSDATLNRGGVRLGTSELYSVVEGTPGVADSLVVHLDDAAGGPGRLVLFVVLDDGVTLDGELTGRLRSALRHGLSPRHVPDDIRVVPAVPRTISGKKLEVPVKRILAGEPADTVANRGALANPDSLDAFVAMAGAGKRCA